MRVMANELRPIGVRPGKRIAATDAALAVLTRGIEEERKIALAILTAVVVVRGTRILGNDIDDGVLSMRGGRKVAIAPGKIGDDDAAILVALDEVPDPDDVSRGDLLLDVDIRGTYTIDGIRLHLANLEAGARA